MEKNHTLDISRKLRDILQARGAVVLMTRDGDSFPNLYSRPQFANQRHADIFISVHINSYQSSSSGTETYYYTGPSLPLAREVHKEMVQALKLPDRRVKSARFVVIRNANMPAILTETAFISNPREEALLMQDSFRQKAAGAMAQGIQNYVDKYLRRTSAG
jgi:N-acetylmuramoyl-L-alanine amidase